MQKAMEQLFAPDLTLVYRNGRWYPNTIADQKVLWRLPEAKHRTYMTDEEVDSLVDMCIELIGPDCSEEN